MSSSNFCFLTCIQISQEGGQVVLYSRLFKNFPQFVQIHIVKGFGIDSKAEVDVFLELSCFFDDPADVGSLISGSSAFSKSSLNIWKFSVHILLKASLENFEHYFANMWEECNCAVVWTFFGIVFFRTGMKTDLFQSCGYCWVSKFASILELHISTNPGILQPHNPKQPSIHLSLPAIPSSKTCPELCLNALKSGQVYFTLNQTTSSRSWTIYCISLLTHSSFCLCSRSPPHLPVQFPRLQPGWVLRH